MPLDAISTSTKFCITQGHKPTWVLLKTSFLKQMSILSTLDRADIATQTLFFFFEQLKVQGKMLWW
jgi:hypothetical protein